MPTVRDSAPGELELVRAFVNSRDVHDAREQLDGPDALAGWLRAHGLADDDAAFSAADLQRATALREALRALLLANTGDELDPRAVATVNRAARRAQLVVALDAGGAGHLEPARGGLDGAVGRLLGIVARAQADGTWARLKACPAHDCHWGFYDRSRNHSRSWCTMQECGNRAKARAYRARRRRADPA